MTLQEFMYKKDVLTVFEDANTMLDIFLEKALCAVCKKKLLRNESFMFFAPEHGGVLFTCSKGCMDKLGS